jgi:hypothetical protein
MSLPKFIPEIKLTEKKNSFYDRTDKKIQPNPYQYEFYNKYVEKVILPYEQNITTLNNFLDQIMLTLQINIFKEIIYYKFNNFDFNYYNSFFITRTIQLNKSITNNDDKKFILQTVILLNNQFQIFIEKLDNLIDLLQNITTPSIEEYLSKLLVEQIEMLENILNNLNTINITLPIITNYDNSLSILKGNNDVINTKITTIKNKLTDIRDNIGFANNEQLDKLDKTNQNIIKNYLSSFILLNSIFSKLEININVVNKEIIEKFNKLNKDNNFLNKIYREKDLQIKTNNLDEVNIQSEKDNLLKTAIFNKNELFGHYEAEKYKRVFLPYCISIENIIELIKLRVNGQLSEEHLNIIIYNYNTFNYTITFGDENNKLFYMNSKIIPNNTIRINSLYNKITSTITSTISKTVSPITKPIVNIAKRVNNALSDKNKNYFQILINNIGTNTIPNITPPTITPQATPIYIYIPITQEINKIYDDAIKKYLFEYNSVPKGIYLKTYNKKIFKLSDIKINQTDKTYNFKYDNSIEVQIPLYDLVKNEKIKTSKLNLFYTDYNYTPIQTQQIALPIQDININILTYYEDIDKEKKEKNIFGTIQCQYNLYILFEQIKTKYNLKQDIYIEDYILCLFESFNENIKIHYILNQYIPIIKNKIIQPLNQLFNTQPNPLLTEQYYFDINEKSNEITYKETNRGIVMIRLICIILYVARIYYETPKKINYLQSYDNIKLNFTKYLRDPTLINNLFDSILNFFETNITLRKINAKFINSIIDGSLFSKEKDLFIKKQSILEKSIETATENIENVASELDTFVHKDSLIDDPFKKIKEKTNDVLNDSINYMFNKKKEDYTSEPVNITDFEEKNFSLTADVIQNRVKKWITGPIYDIPDWMPEIDDVNNINILNNKIVYPEVIQFISEYLNNKSETDLISIKNKEQICKNISSLKNTIEKNTSEIKYILPKTFFDDEYFMKEYNKKLEENQKKIQSQTNKIL